MVCRHGVFFHFKAWYFFLLSLIFFYRQGKEVTVQSGLLFFAGKAGQKNDPIFISYSWPLSHRPEIVL